MREVLDQLMSIKKRANDIAIDLLDDRSLALFIDTNNLLDKDKWEITREVIDALDSSNHNRWKFKPRLHFSVVVYPTKEGDIYGYYFDSDKKEFYDLLKPFYTDFYYQNQTDPPTDVSEEEWKFRELKWDELLPGDEFSDSGLKYDIVTGETLDIWDLEDKIEIILDKMKRDRKIENLGI
jgi:hypothetical protein